MPSASGRSTSFAIAGWIRIGRRSRDGLDFNLAYIPAGFNAPHKEEFDTGYMRALFNVGFDLAAAKGYPWEKVPPDYADTHHPR